MNKSQYFRLGSFCYVLGVLLFLSWPNSLPTWLILLLFSFAIGLAIILNKIVTKSILLSILCFIIGYGHPSLNHSIATTAQLLTLQNTTTAQGVIINMPENKNYQQKITIRLTDPPLSHINVLLFSDNYQKFYLGDHVQVSGKFTIPKNFNNFDYKGYLQAQNIYFIMHKPQITLQHSNRDWRNFIEKFRNQAQKNLAKIIPEPQAGILNAMTLGIKTSIDSQTLDDFSKTGTRHIIAVSGMHLVIVVTILSSLLLACGINRKYIFFIITFSIIIFVFITGMASSVIRAGIMASTGLLAQQVGRKNTSLNALILAGVLMLLHNPYLLTKDIGFQLSFSATLGIITIYPYLKNITAKIPALWGFKDTFLVTTSAQLAITPLLILHFHNLSIFTLIVNTLILFLMPLIMMGGFLAIFLSFINLSIAKIIIFPVYLALTYQLLIINYFAKLNIGIIYF